MKRGTALAAIAALWIVFEAKPAHAYLDPSTGSMLLSAIVAFFATAAMAVRTYWYRIVSLVRGSPDAAKHKEPAAGPERPSGR